jgi:hypothetical protein
MGRGFRQQTVWVTNRNKGEGFAPFVDMFDGEEWAFPMNEPVEIPVIVAQHIFGYGLAEGSPGYIFTLARHSWNLLKDNKGVIILSNFEITEESPKARAS